jgi:hypothetical protein
MTGCRRISTEAQPEGTTMNGSSIASTGYQRFKP